MSVRTITVAIWARLHSLTLALLGRPWEEPGKEKMPPGDCVGIHSCGSLELFVSVKRWSRVCLHHTARSSDLEEFSPGKKQKEGRRKEIVKTRDWIVAQLVK